jgi:hypothetical protein
LTTSFQSSVTVPGSRGLPAALGGAATVNRDELLQALFPDGLPPREDVIRRVSSWLDEAEQLVKL